MINNTLKQRSSRYRETIVKRASNGLYLTRKGWFYQMTLNRRTVRNGPFSCPVFGLNERITRRNKNREEKLKPYKAECLSCKKVITVVPKKNGKKTLRCEPCRKIRISLRRKAEDKKVYNLRKYKSFNHNYDVKKRICLRCDKKFKSYGKYNRVCDSCSVKMDYSNRTCKVVFAKKESD